MNIRLDYLYYIETTYFGSF